jgi:hypothetical protein
MRSGPFSWRVRYLDDSSHIPWIEARAQARATAYRSQRRRTRRCRAVVLVGGPSNQRVEEVLTREHHDFSSKSSSRSSLLFEHDRSRKPVSTPDRVGRRFFAIML